MEACEAAACSLNHIKLPDENHPDMLHTQTKELIKYACQQDHLGNSTKKNPPRSAIFIFFLFL